MSKEGRFDAYQALKQAFLEDGLSPSDAFRFAAVEFQRMDGLPHEIPNLPPRQQHGHVIDDPANKSQVSPEDEIFLDGEGGFDDEGESATTEGIQQGGECDLAETGSDAEGSGEVSAPTGNGETRPRRPGRPFGSKSKPKEAVAAPAAPPPPAIPPEGIVVPPPERKPRQHRPLGPTARDIARKKLDEEKAYKDLYSDVPKGKDASLRMEAMWIMDNLHEDFCNIQTAEVPSRRALGQLRMIREGGIQAYKDFNTSIYSKFIPARPENEEEGGIGGSDADYRRSFEEFEKSFYGEDNPDNSTEFEEEGEAADVDFHDQDDDQPAGSAA